MKELQTISPAPLEYYDRARKDLSHARRVDEVKDVRDKAIAMATYAHQAKDKQMVADAAEIRERATRCLGEMMAAQRANDELNKGAAQPHKRESERGKVATQVSPRPALAAVGIDKHLADRARKTAAMSEQEFENEHIPRERQRAAKSVEPRSRKRFVPVVNLDDLSGSVVHDLYGAICEAINTKQIQTLLEYKHEISPSALSDLLDTIERCQQKLSELKTQLKSVKTRPQKRLQIEDKQT